MNTQPCSLFVGVALLALTSAANASQPVTLSDNQMDHVTAGAYGEANSAALALGDVDAVTLTATNTYAEDSTLLLAHRQFAIGQSYSQAVAASLQFNAAAVTHSDTSAGLP